MVKVNDIAITSIDEIAAFDVLTGDYKFTVDELQNTNISQTQDKEDITGKQGRKLTSLKRNKAVTISGANGLVSGGIMELQTGSKFENKLTEVMWRDYLTVQSGAASTKFTAIGTEGAEIKAVVIRNSDGTLGKELTQNSTTESGKFTYDPESKVLEFNAEDVPDNTEIIVYYKRQINADVLENRSDIYSGKAMLYIDATGEDKCSNIYHIQFFIPKADFSGEFEIEMGESQTVHNFEAEALAGACGAGGALWTYTIFGVDTKDAA